MRLFNRIGHAIAGLVLTVAAGAPSYADDTEIFEGSPSAAQRPNVLFVIDTSGSMATAVQVRPDYDPNTTYSGSCNSNDVYWKLKPRRGTPTPPACASNTDYIDGAVFVCQSARGEIAKTGVYTIGPAAQWNAGTRTWQDLVGGLNNTYVECEDDESDGHGIVAGDRKVAANAGNGPFTASTALGISWRGFRNYVFYSGNFLNYYAIYSSLPATKSRLQIVQEATKRIVDSPNLDGTNVALMQFNSRDYTVGGSPPTLDGTRGGMVVYPFTQIETARTALPSIIDGLAAESWTPLSEVLYEAYLFLTGGTVDYGSDSTPSVSVAGSRVGDTLSSSTYKKTIDRSCEQTYVVYLTDGQPTRDQDATAPIQSLPGVGTCAATGVAGDDNTNGVCLDELAQYMFDNDLYDDPTLTPAMEAKENVITYTIGFGNSVPAYAQKLLEDTAAKGGGENFVATDDASLLEAFQSIVSDIDDDGVTFTAPTVSVNAFNRTRTLDDLFFSVFQPDRRYHWPGNLKKYRVNSTGVLIDAAGNDAVDVGTGFFKSSARSIWTPAADPADGADVTMGGAANLLPTARNIYTYMGTNAALTHASNAVADATSAITGPMLGLPAAAVASDRSNLIDWIRGASVPPPSGGRYVSTPTTGSRKDMGDPLHAQPATVIYGGSVASPIAVVYTATNDGYLHAIDATTGTELWSFVPRELLPRMYDLYTNALSRKRYGLDGSITVYRLDNDNDGVIEPAAPDNDKVYLFFGMGRGGYHYYALDVTDRTSPQFKWMQGSSGTLTGVGETWSTPVITHINFDNGSSVQKTLVMIVGGGYDPTQDGGNTTPANQALYHTDTVGNHVYILNAETGALLWRAGPTGDTGAQLQLADMVNSIPADMRVIDMNSDGLADRMYTGDMGGRVWRFDIINGQTAANLVRGGVFASLGVASGVGTNPTDARRFYNPPDASLLRVGNAVYVNLIIGSGFRGHPLNTHIQDRIYSLRDPVVFRAMTAAEYSSLTPIRDNSSLLIDVTSDANATMPANAQGWKLSLGAGEKVLVEAVTFGGVTILPVFSPTGNTGPTFSCTSRTGTNFLYTFNSGNGSANNDRDNDGTIEVSDRSVTLKQQGIAPSAVFLFPSASTPTTTTVAGPPPCNPADPTCVLPPPPPTPPTMCPNGLVPPTVVAFTGAETVPVTFSNCPQKTFWQQGTSE